ncbi:MAG: zinc ribbon domain-containing protein [Chloroflexi bacterium]|nr:zinc ribbon domain-containing protein [Chloroflexota bacterium]
MFCASCGKRIPPESTFCLHCGARVAPLSPSFSETSSNSISLVVDEFRPCGVPKVETGYLNKRIRRGFEFTIHLHGPGERQTKAGGELIAALRGPYPNASVSPRLLEPTLEAAREIAAAPDVLWHRSFSVGAGDFVSPPPYSRGLQARGERAIPAFTYRETAPILSADEDYHIELHLWFALETGQCLYQYAQTIWSG